MARRSTPSGRASETVSVTTASDAGSAATAARCAAFSAACASSFWLARSTPDCRLSSASCSVRSDGTAVASAPLGLLWPQTVKVAHTSVSISRADGSRFPVRTPVRGGWSPGFADGERARTCSTRQASNSTTDTHSSTSTTGASAWRKSPTLPTRVHPARVLSVATTLLNGVSHSMITLRTVGNGSALAVAGGDVVDAPAASAGDLSGDELMVLLG